MVGSLLLRATFSQVHMQRKIIKMASKPKSVRSLSVYETQIKALGGFRIVTPCPTDPKTRVALGLSERPAEGDSVLPTPRGSVSSYNSRGREIIRKDLPKVWHTVAFFSTWNDWHGHPHSGIKHRSQQVYPRVTEQPPEEYLTLMKSDGRLVLASRALDVKKDSETSIIHVINLFLELFGDLEVVSPDLATLHGMKTRRLDWRVLPPGEYPFARASKELKIFLDVAGEAVRPVIEERVKLITRHTPEFLAVGTGGFNDYVVFGFPKKELYVLESSSIGNATYVFKKNWQVLSKLTKKEILDGNLHDKRIIHDEKWSRTINQLLTSK